MKTSSSKRLKHAREIGERWVNLAIYHKDDLKYVFVQLFSNNNLMNLYKPDDSFIWQCKNEIIDCFNHLPAKNIVHDCDDIQPFILFL